MDVHWRTPLVLLLGLFALGLFAVADRARSAHRPIGQALSVPAPTVATSEPRDFRVVGFFKGEGRVQEQLEWLERSGVLQKTDELRVDCSGPAFRECLDAGKELRTTALEVRGRSMGSMASFLDSVWSYCRTNVKDIVWITHSNATFVKACFDMVTREGADVCGDRLSGAPYLHFPELSVVARCAHVARLSAQSAPFAAGPCDELNFTAPLSSVDPCAQSVAGPKHWITSIPSPRYASCKRQKCGWVSPETFHGASVTSLLVLAYDWEKNLLRNSASRVSHPARVVVGFDSGRRGDIWRKFYRIGLEMLHVDTMHDIWTFCREHEDLVVAHSGGGNGLQKINLAKVHKACVSGIMDGATVCGISLEMQPFMHFSRNVWWATCKHIASLEDPSVPVSTPCEHGVKLLMDPPMPCLPALCVGAERYRDLHWVLESPHSVIVTAKGGMLSPDDLKRPPTQCSVLRAAFDAWAVIRRQSRGVKDEPRQLQGVRILIVDDGILKHDEGAGFPRMVELVHVLMELGAKVTFLSLRKPWSDEDKKPWAKHGMAVISGFNKWQEMKKSAKRLFDVAICSRIRNWLELGLNKESFPVPIIYDTETLTYMRVRGSANFDQERAVELDAIVKAPHVWLLARSDVEQLKRENVSRQLHVRVVGMFSPVFPGPHVPLKERKCALFVGAFHGATFHNGDAVLWFVSNVMPLVLGKVPDFCLQVRGTSVPGEITAMAAANPRVYLLADASSQQLEKDLRSSILFVAPHRYGGAGLPLKVVSALSYGLPVVYSKWLGDAFSFDATGRNGGLLVDTAEEMANGVARVWTDQSLWYAMHKAAQAYARLHFSKRVFRQQVLDSVKVALQR